LYNLDLNNTNITFGNVLNSGPTARQTISSKTLETKPNILIFILLVFSIVEEYFLKKNYT
jgi:hypothetical protein